MPDFLLHVWPWRMIEDAVTLPPTAMTELPPESETPFQPKLACAGPIAGYNDLVNGDHTSSQ